MTTTNLIFPPGPNASEDEIIRWREDVSNGQSSIINGDITTGSGIDPETGKPVDVWEVPPAPTVFAATAAVSTIILEWTVPDITYVQYSEIYRGVVDNIDDAATERIATIENNNNSVVFDRVWTDNPPDPEVGATYYYWLRFLNSAGTPGPLYQQAGVSASLPKDPSYMLEQLAESIGYGEFDVANGVFPVRVGTVLPTLPDSDWPIGSTFFDTDEGVNGKLYKTEDGLTWNASVDGGDIDDFTVIGDKIAANAITASKILIKDYTNLIANPSFTDGTDDGWVGIDTTPEASIQPTTTALYGYYVRMESNTTMNLKPLDGARIPVKVGESFNFEMVAYRPGGTDIAAKVRILLAVYDKDGSILAYMNYLPAITSGNTWTSFDNMFTVAEADAESAEILIGPNGFGAAGTYLFATEFRFRKAANAVLIVDGAISTDSLQANAIVSGKIAAGAIIAEHVGANEIIANTANLKDLVVINAKIGNLAVDSAKLGSLAVTTAKINNLAVTQGKIALLAVDTAQIRDAAIETAKINNAAITTAKIGDAQITTAKIGSAQVQTLNIQDDAVTVPVSSFVSAGSGLSTTYVSKATAVINALGQPVVSTFVARCKIYKSPPVGGGNGVTVTCRWYVDGVADGDEVIVVSSIPAAFDIGEGVVYADVNDGSIALARTFTGLATGNRTIAVYIKASTSNAVDVYSRSLVLLGVKK
jgi:hypothetical protein